MASVRGNSIVTEGDRHHAKRLRILDRAGGGPTSSGWRFASATTRVIVGESEGAVRFRVGEGWDIDIYKPMILAVEQIVGPASS